MGCCCHARTAQPSTNGLDPKEQRAVSNPTFFGERGSSDHARDFLRGLLDFARVLRAVPQKLYPERGALKGLGFSRAVERPLHLSFRAVRSRACAVRTSEESAVRSLNRQIYLPRNRCRHGRERVSGATRGIVRKECLFPCGAIRTRNRPKNLPRWLGVFSDRSKLRP